jgi:YD repeat-containing protein
MYCDRVESILRSLVGLLPTLAAEFVTTTLFQETAMQKFVFLLTTAFIFIGPRSLLAQAPVSVPDNILTPASNIGLPPGVSTEGDFEQVNLTNGALSTFIPAVTLPQRAGVKPLVLGFTYNSTQYELRQDTEVAVSSVSAGTQDSDSGFFYPDASGYAPYDTFSYTETIQSTVPFGWLPFEINLPYLRATIEYMGDAWLNNGGPGEPIAVNVGLNYSIIPQMCVTNFTFTDWAGSTHPFPAVVSECSVGARGYNNYGGTTPITGSLVNRVGDSGDNSFYRLDATNLSDIAVTDEDGTVYHFPSQVVYSLSSITGTSQNEPPSGGQTSDSPAIQTVPSSIVDRNGATISISGQAGTAQYTLTDTVGRTISIDYGQPSSQNPTPPAQISYNDSDGAPQTVTLSYSRSISTPYPDAGFIAPGTYTCSTPGAGLGPPATQYNQPFLTITGSQTSGTNDAYAVTYSGAPDRVFGIQVDSQNRLVKIAYPSGGYRRYDYSVVEDGQTSCIWAQSFVSHKYECFSSSGVCEHENATAYDYGSPSGSTTLCGTENGILLPNVLHATVTDPFGTKTTHCFDEYIDEIIPLAPAEHDTYIVDANGNQLEHVHNDFQGAYAGSFPFPTKTTTTIQTAGGTNSFVEQRTYDGIAEIIQGADVAAARQGQSTIYPITNPIAVAISGYDGNVLRYTLNNYWYSGHIWDKTLSTTTMDPVTDVQQTTSFNYDSHGNLLSKTVTGSTDGPYTTSYTLDGFGRPASVTDPRGAVTTLDYSDNYANSACAPSTSVLPNAFLTSITNALQQTTKYAYFRCTGAISSVTDANLKKTAYGYDSISRLTEIDAPDTGVTNIGITDTPPNQVMKTVHAAPDPNIVTITSFDGFARNASVLDGAGAVIATTYDALGRAQSVTNPYWSSGSPSGTTTFQYDALNRKVSETLPDGNLLYWCYNGVQNAGQPNCVANQSALTDAGSWIDSTDEAGVHYQHASDAAGDLRHVVEPNPATGTLGLHTTYGYDGFGDLVAVTQNGVSGTDTARGRSFSYDSLSRLFQAYNPESGWVCYGTTAGALPNGSNCTSGSGYDANGNLIAKTDARGVTTTYFYDALNRLFAKNYSDAPAGTMNSCLSYDSASNGVGRLGFEWTQSASCPTTQQASALPAAGQYQSLRVFGYYDAMGRVASERQCAAGYCTSAAVPSQPPANCMSLTGGSGLQYCYDLAGNLLAYANGLNSAAAGSYSQAVMGFSQTFNSAGRLAQITSSLTDNLHPPTLFTVDPANGYTPAGAIQSMILGNNISVTKTYDIRLRPTGETAMHP